MFPTTSRFDDDDDDDEYDGNDDSDGSRRQRMTMTAKRDYSNFQPMRTAWERAAFQSLSSIAATADHDDEEGPAKEKL